MLLFRLFQNSECLGVTFQPVLEVGGYPGKTLPIHLAASLSRAVDAPLGVEDVEVPVPEKRPDLQPYTQPGYSLPCRST